MSSSPKSKARAALIHDLETAVRRSSAQGVIFGQVVATTAGLSGSDLETVDFLNLENGRATAGRLAELTGLTTGAITGLVDRLERAGLVRRERDAVDRRKVFIAIVPEAVEKIGALYAPLQQAMLKEWSSYSDDELKLLLRFTTRGYEVMLAATAQVKATGPASSPASRGRRPKA